MKEMSNVEKIKAEIERLYDGEAPKHDQQCDFNDGYFMGIDTVSQFIDSLPNNDFLDESIIASKDLDLDKEYNDFVESDPVYSKLVNNIVGKAIARHFAEWGAKHLKM